MSTAHAPYHTCLIHSTYTTDMPAQGDYAERTDRFAGMRGLVLWVDYCEFLLATNAVSLPSVSLVVSMLDRARHALGEAMMPSSEWVCDGCGACDAEPCGDADGHAFCAACRAKDANARRY